MGKTIRAKKGHGKDTNNSTNNEISKNNDSNKEKRKEKKRNKGRSGGCDDTRELSCILEQSGLTILHMDGDGNCLFRSIADQLTGNPELHMMFRSRIMKYIETHGEHFKLFMEDDESFDDYISRMSESSEWGGHHELYAASQCLNVNITVYQLNSPVYVLEAKNGFINDNKSIKPTPQEIKLSYHGDCHYNSVRRMDNEMHTSTGGSTSNTTIIEKNSCTNKIDLYIPEEDIILVHNSVPWIERTQVIQVLTEQKGNIDTTIELLCADISAVAIDTNTDCVNSKETDRITNIQRNNTNTTNDIEATAVSISTTTGTTITTTTTTANKDTTTNNNHNSSTTTEQHTTATTTTTTNNNDNNNNSKIKSYRKSGKDKPLSKKVCYCITYKIL